jgi:hypothetical protein
MVLKKNFLRCERKEAFEVKIESFFHRIKISQQNSFSNIEKKNSVRESTSKQIQFQEKQLEIKSSKPQLQKN